MSSVAPGLAISAGQFATLIDTCRRLEGTDKAGARLLSLTVPV
jgi:hypothetical protein